MSTLLIASIGKGKQKNNTSGYSNVLYSDGVNGEKILSTPYAFEAITSFYKPDKLLLLGTAGSDWSSLYEYLCGQQKIEPDEDIDLFAMQQASNPNAFNTPLHDMDCIKQPIISLLTKQMFDRADILFMKYGLNEEELLENFELLQQIDGMVDDGDEIIFDITHSFRSLAFFEMIAVNYINSLQKKNITIKKVTYGMLELSRQLPSTPIVDLKPLLTTMDLMNAVREFEQFGTTYALCDILNSYGDECGLGREERRAVNRLNDAVCINDIPAFKSMVNCCHRVIRNSKDEVKNSDLRLLANRIYAEIANRFTEEIIADDIRLELEIAKWHLDHKRYLISVTSLQEVLITFGARVCGMNPDKQENRDIIRQKMNQLNCRDRDIAGNFFTQYNNIRKLRNPLAHPIGNIRKDDTAKKLSQEITGTVTLYKNHFAGDGEKAVANRAQLKEALEATRI